MHFNNNKRPPRSPKEAWPSDGRQVCHFRPSRLEVLRLWSENRRQGRQTATDQWQLPKAPPR
jgi:hypothetical protein